MFGAFINPLLFGVCLLAGAVPVISAAMVLANEGATYRVLCAEFDGYKLVALTKAFTDYRAHFLARADSQARTVTDKAGFLPFDAPAWSAVHGWIATGIK